MSGCWAPDHPNTRSSRHYLAYAYESAGQLDKAIALYEATLADTERVILLLEATLADCERVLGPDHPTTRIVRDNLRRAGDDPNSA